jgi:death on curing protein
VSSDEPLFLEVDDVLEIHATQLDVYGGGAGLRDQGLLESAVAHPRASFGGDFAHEGLFAMAAAYLFHIVKNHPFVDGNKRTGLLAAIVFLDVNGIGIEHPSEALFELTMDVAEGRIDKAAVAVELERIARART